MSDEPHSTSKKQSQIARYAVINGIPKACDKFLVSPDEVERWISTLQFEDLPLFEKAREMIIETCIRKGSKGASRYWGISEDTIKSLIRDYISIVDKDSLEMVDFNAQINPNSFKEYKEIRTQTKDKHLEGEEFTPKPRKIQKKKEEKRIVSKYTTAQKIQAVREFVRHQNQSEAARELSIPAVNLMRWRDKIKKELFQASHVEHLYMANKKGQSNKFFRDIDESLNGWYNLHRDSIQNKTKAIKEKAAKLAKLDDTIPEISEEWLEHFKEFYKIK
ncbi:unnamed protein product [Blepharisma stoltei]|uniref:HTH CENPB-type domain-containing protein n=1 Tax=Blepharisma stoltei TaxID=1481888 RepID=A0AAU9K827_9CILI|nr:unnamed protein product [Blepharisma stoltei]